MNKRKYTVAAVAVLAAIVPAVLQLGAGAGQQVKEETKTVRVAKGSVAPVLSITGVIAADERQVNPQTGGTVKEIYVHKGDMVAAGQKLLALDDADAQSDVNISWASYASAKAQRQELVDKGASAAQIAAQDAQISKAWADYSKADKARDSVVLTSPIAGTVINLGLDVGDQASAGSSGAGASSGGSGSGGSSGSSAAVTVADLTRLHIKASIDQADISKVIVNQEAKITLDALPGKESTGQVTSIDPVPTTNQNVVTYTVYLAISNLDSAARLGMTCDINIDVGKKDGVLVVPNMAVRSKGNAKVVTKMIDGRESEVTVETGASDEENTEITSGLLAGDGIVPQSLTPQGSGGSFSGNQAGGRGGMMMGGPPR